MLKIIVDDKEVGVEDNFIGDIHYEVTIDSDVDCYDVMNTFVRVMKIMEYQDDSIKRALKDALERMGGDNE